MIGQIAGGASRPNAVTAAQPAVAVVEISVIVPARNAAGDLGDCLRHLQASEDCQFEIIVVDDASTDATVEVAKAMGARVISLGEQCGPAVARNRGALIAAGDMVVFIDADVFVNPSTVSQLANCLHDSKYDAVIGSYDASPIQTNLISQYKNLLHHHTHQIGNLEASTFWSGCGAIRRERFLELGGFSEDYHRPCMEDIELGTRLRKAGARILLNPKIQATHAKRWTLTSLVKTDFFDRALPWTRLILRQHSMPNDLNVRVSQRFSVICVALMVLLIAISSWWEPEALLLLATMFMFVCVIDRIEGKEIIRWGRRAGASAMVGTFCAMSLLAPATALVIALTFVAVALLNLPLIRFFADNRGLVFGILTVPLHILYFFYSGLAFAVGVVLHVVDLLLVRQQTCERVTEVSEVA